MSTEKTIDISVLPEAEQDLIKALFDKCCERVNQKEKTNLEFKVWKPKYGETYHYIDGSGSIYSAIWFNSIVDKGRWVLGNVFKTQEEEVFARKKRKVEVELERYAKEHNGAALANRCYCIRYEEDGKRLLCDTLATTNIQGVVMFTSRDVLVGAIEAIGRDRILKYIFGAESEVKENE